MIEFIGFIIKLIFGGLLGGICGYNRSDSQNESSAIFTGGIIGVIGTISTSFGISAGDNFSGFLLGMMVLASILISKTIMNEIGSKIGTREVFALIVGWFVGIGNILHGIVLTLFLIFFLIRFTENKNEKIDD
jgi:hypothetical protein